MDDFKTYKDKIDAAINDQKTAKDADKSWTFPFPGNDGRLYAFKGSITGAKAAADAITFDVGLVEACAAGLAYGLGVVAFEPCGLDNTFALQRMLLSSASLKARVLKTVLEMTGNKDYVGLVETGLMDLSTNVLELHN